MSTAQITAGYGDVETWGAIRSTQDPRYVEREIDPAEVDAEAEALVDTWMADVHRCGEYLCDLSGRDHYQLALLIAMGRDEEAGRHARESVRRMMKPYALSAALTQMSAEQED